MQRWEYLEVQVFGANWSASKRESGEFTQIGKMSTIARALERWGQQGWELVAAVPTSTAMSSVYNLYLKRRAESGSEPRSGGSRGADVHPAPAVT